MTTQTKEKTKARPKMKGEGRVYKYGSRAPAKNLDLVLEQFRLAHRYRNKLCELELHRRARVDDALRNMAPGLLEVEAELGHPAIKADREKGTPAVPATGVEAELEAALDVVNRRRIDERGRKPNKEEQAAVREIKERRKDLFALRKALRAALFESEPWQAIQAEIEAEDNSAVKSARSECGLYWGTYLQVEQAAKSMRKGAPPGFRPWRHRKDKIAVQLQGGLSVGDLLSGKDRRVKLSLKPRPGAKPGSRRGELRLHGTLCMRIGSNGRDPVWAEVPICYHRPIPTKARIKWVYLIRRDLGPHSRWTAQFVLEADSWQSDDLATDGAVGVDVGWRVMGDGRLRVAVWSDSRGQEGELALPAYWLSEMRKTRHLRSLRDEGLDAIRARVCEEFPDERAWVSQTRSTSRVAALLVKARSEGLTVAKDLEVWRKRDKHLLCYEVNLRDQLQASRLDLYRCFAARLARSYKTIVLEDLDLREFHKLPPVEDGMTHEQDVVRAYVRDAALSILTNSIKARSPGVMLVDPKDTTLRCHACGHVDRTWKEPARARLRHECPECKLLWDQDVNAARNLLQGGASGQVVTWDRDPLEPDEIMSYHPDGPNREMRKSKKRQALEMKRAMAGLAGV